MIDEMEEVQKVKHDLYLQETALAMRYNEQLAKEKELMKRIQKLKNIQKVMQKLSMPVEDLDHMVKIKDE